MNSFKGNCLSFILQVIENRNMNIQQQNINKERKQNMKTGFVVFAALRLLCKKNEEKRNERKKKSKPKKKTNVSK